MCSHTFGAYKQKKCYFHAKIYAKVLQISRIVVPLHVKKLAVMVNGTTYAKKLRLNIRNGNRNIDIKIR